MCLAWEHIGLAGQEVGKAYPTAGVPYPTTTEETKAPEGGAGKARLSDGAETEQPNPSPLRRKVARCGVDPTLGRPDPVTAPGDVSGGAGAI
jgi:hypothetical protein